MPEMGMPKNIEIFKGRIRMNKLLKSLLLGGSATALAAGAAMAQGGALVVPLVEQIA